MSANKLQVLEEKFDLMHGIDNILKLLELSNLLVGELYFHGNLHMAPVDYMKMSHVCTAHSRNLLAHEW